MNAAVETAPDASALADLPPRLSRTAFGERFRWSFIDPAFELERGAIARIEEIAWQAYCSEPAAPQRGDAARAERAPAVELPLADPPPLLADPGDDLGDVWRETRVRLRNNWMAPEPARRARVLLLRACPAGHGEKAGEAARLAAIAAVQLRDEGIDAEIADLPAAADAATLATRWQAADGVLLCACAPAPEALLRAIGRAAPGKPSERVPRAYALLLHGDCAASESLRRSLSDRLDELGLIDAAAQTQLDRFVGCYEAEAAVVPDERARSTARSLAHVIDEVRAGRLHGPALLLSRPRSPQ